MLLHDAHAMDGQQVQCARLHCLPTPISSNRHTPEARLGGCLARGNHWQRAGCGGGSVASGQRNAGTLCRNGRWKGVGDVVAREGGGIVGPYGKAASLGVVGDLDDVGTVGKGGDDTDGGNGGGAGGALVRAGGHLVGSVGGLVVCWCDRRTPTVTLSGRGATPMVLPACTRILSAVWLSAASMGPSKMMDALPGRSWVCIVIDGSIGMRTVRHDGGI